MPDRREPTTPPDGPPCPSQGLAFPSVARLELDDLLDQLIARATEVKLTQSRLRGLLDAVHHITAGLDLDDLVARIVENARDLVHARYAALGVVRDGRLIRFVHVGMDHGTVARIGELPQGKGVLGELIDHPRSLRLGDLSTHPSAVGFPEHHPPMRSFLGVPLVAGGTVYGNLYVTESEHGGFGSDDEQLLTALAGAAGIAIENALLLDGARRRARWQAAAARLASSLLSGELPPDAEIRHLLDTAVETAAAHGGAITEVADDDAGTAVPVAAGLVADWADRSTTAPGSLTRAALDEGGPVLVTDATTDPRTTTTVEQAPEVRSVLAVPLATPLTGSTPGTRSVLVLTRSGSEEAFGPVEAEMLPAFAAQAATAIELARGRRDREAVRTLEDREQLVLALSEQVLARVQRVGLALTSAASGTEPALRDHLLAQVAELDDVTRAVRDTVFPR